MRLRWRARQTFEKLFPERQIYHRSGGTVRFVSLSPWRQALLAGGAAAFVGWSMYATSVMILQGSDAWKRDKESSRKEERNERWLAEARAKESAALALLDERTSEFEKATAEFERRHETLKVLLSVAGGSDADIATSSQVLASNGARMLPRAGIDEADPREGRAKEISYVAPNGVKQLSSRLDHLRDEQSAFLDTAEDEAVQRSEELRGVIRMTGVGVARIMDNSSMGGPLIPLDTKVTARLATETDPEFATRVTQVAARLEEMRQLENVASSAPLSAPLASGFRTTSGFGVRTDPFNNRMAFHSGLDFAGYRGAPIRATAPGVVTYTGQRSGYGNVVEIDHNHGFKTRYAHLSSIAPGIRPGSRVAIGDVVGGMGSTGRSTGTHLHYEVWFRDKVYDPRNFLRAGRHVHEG
ncbi:MAG: peptidoglycan DD-metalloendopeptidase family protein [Caulobacterales bacterium]